MKALQYSHTHHVTVEQSCAEIFTEEQDKRIPTFTTEEVHRSEHDGRDNWRSNKLHAENTWSHDDRLKASFKLVLLAINPE